jgi:pilus assembly protein CpaB
MKWSIVGLLLLGIGAAVAASILVASLKSGAPALASTSVTPAEMQIMVAAKPMAAMSIVEARSVLTKTVPANEAPANSMRRPTDVIGKLLTVPIVEGQVLTSTCFADEKSGARLASALANGMRAVSVSLTPDKAGLLYAGSIVDVLVSLNRPSTEGSGTMEAMSMTLLQGVQVLAIDDTSVMSDPASSEPSTPETAASARRGQRDRRLVTLMVNSNQAKALQLAAQYGAVSLALRNPLDTAPVKTDSTMLSDLADEYTRIVAALSPPQSGEPKADDHSQPSNPTQTGQDTRADRPGQDHAALMNARREQLAEDKAPRPARLLIGQPEDPKWETLVNRSGQIELVRFRRPGELWPQDALQWIWEGRALSGTNANTK